MNITLSALLKSAALTAVVVVAAVCYSKEDSGKLMNPHKILSDMQQAIGYDTHVITLSIVDDTQINAYATGEGKIVITTGMLDHVENESELASVIGHELAHFTLGHVELISLLGEKPEGIFLKSQTMEAMSDLIGSQFAAMAGYGKCGGFTLWSRMANNGNFGTGDGSHPDSATRAHSAKNVCKS